jgi:tetratricopeptide (TPR) repeat protein
MTVHGVRRAIAALATFLAACASVPIPELFSEPQLSASASTPTLSPPPPYPFADMEGSYRERAIALAREGRWVEEQAVWEILLLLNPDSSEYRMQLEQTQKRIAEAVAEHSKAGEKALKAGDLDQATIRYLRVLSLDPHNAAAARALRETESARMRRAYLSRSPRLTIASRPSSGNAVARSANEASELELAVMLFKQGNYAGSAQALEKYLQKHAQDDVARGYLADANHQLGLASLQKGRKEEALAYLEKARSLGNSDQTELANTIRSLRRALGDEYYRLGLQAFASSIDKAIALWERSLYYDPSHPQASIRLQQARRAERTMRSIEQNDKKN